MGRGYPFPRKKLRWCTDRLKIQPVNKFVKEQIAEHGEIILVIGTRKAESARRAKTMAYYEKKRVRELLSPSSTMANELVFHLSRSGQTMMYGFFLCNIEILGDILIQIF